MSQALIDLEARASAWLGSVGGGKTASGIQGAQGWALCQHLRRMGRPGERIARRVEGHLSPADSRSNGPTLSAVDSVAAGELLRKAESSLDRLLADLDGDETDADAIERGSRDVFFDLLDALRVADAVGADGGQGGAEGRKQAQSLFNRAVGELYAFEPVADLAAALRSKLVGKVGLADLLCAGVAGYAARAPQAVEIEEANEQAERTYVPIEELVFAGGEAATLTLDELARRLGRSAWYVVQWGVHRVRLVVQPALHALRFEVHTGGAATASAASIDKGMDGWAVRLDAGREPLTSNIRAGVASLKLPDRVDAGRFVLRLKRPDSPDWQPLFGRQDA